MVRMQAFLPPSHLYEHGKTYSLNELGKMSGLQITRSSKVSFFQELINLPTGEWIYPIGIKGVFLVTTQILLLSLVTVGARLEPNLTSAISSKLFCSILVQVSNVVGDVFVVDKVVVEVEDSVNENKSSIVVLYDY